MDNESFLSNFLLEINVRSREITVYTLNKKLPTFIHFKSRQFGSHSKQGQQKAIQMP